MNGRRFAIILLAVAGLVFLFTLVTRKQSVNNIEPPDQRTSSAPPVEESAALAHPAPRPELAPELQTSLRRLALTRGARINEAILTFVSADAYQRFLGRAQHRRLTVLGQLDALLAVRVRYDSLEALEADLRENGADFSDIAANHLIRVPGIPAKAERELGNPIPFRNSTLAYLGASADRSAWGRGTTVAILDTGVAPDDTFGGARVQYLNIGLGTLPGSGMEDGHGTAVAALAAGRSADAAGVAPSATVLSIRVTDANGGSDIFTVAQAIVAAVDARASIINLSLGGYATTAALNSAIDYAVAHGAMIVAAAGNDQATQLAWPAADPRVISVGAVDALGRQVAFSNSGPQLQISAPGYGVQTAWLGDERVYVSGTSASAPLVAGAIAAVMSQNAALTAQQAWSIVQKTTSDAGPPGADADYGNGILNLDWAMNASNLNRADPAVASQYYSAATNEISVVVQNRSAQPARGLTLDVDTNGTTKNYRLPEIPGGGEYVLPVSIDPHTMAAANGLTITSQLVTPFGLADANVGNNRLSSHLVAPPPAK